MGWFVYMLRCRDGSLYTGSTTDLDRRLASHQSGKGAKYTRSRLPVELAYWETAADKSAALRREAAIKRLTRENKLALIKAKEEGCNMRRKDRERTAEEAWQIVEDSSYGVISMIAEDGTSYGVPVNIVREGSAVYFHCALEGKKVDAMRKNPQVCLVCVDQDEIIGEKLTTRYGCAMVFGTASEITEEAEKKEALRRLCLRHAPDHMDEFERSLGSIPRTAVWKITAEQITGKTNR